MSQNHRLNSRARQSQKRSITRRDGLKCKLCGLPIESLEMATLDHIIPWSKGGTNRQKNLQLAHLKCNRKKGNEISPAGK